MTPNLQQSSVTLRAASIPLIARMIYSSVKRLDFLLVLLGLYAREIQIPSDPVFGCQLNEEPSLGGMIHHHEVTDEPSVHRHGPRASLTTSASRPFVSGDPVIFVIESDELWGDLPRRRLTKEIQMRSSDSGDNTSEIKISYDITRLVRNLDMLRQFSSGVAMAVAANIGRIQGVLLQTNEAVEPILREVAQFQKTQLPQLIEFARQFVEGIEKWEENERIFVAHLAQRGWLLSPSDSIQTWFKLRKAIKEHGIDAVESQLVQLYDPDACERMLKECVDRPSYKAWEAKFQRAMAAHRRGEFDLAIPIWLMAAEGILSAELSRDGRRIDNVYTLVKRKNGRYIRDAFVDTSSKGEAFLDGMIEVLRLFGRHSSQLESGTSILHRHSIMHGNDPNFGTEKDSIQCILLLEVIHMYLESNAPLPCASDHA